MSSSYWYGEMQRIKQEGFAVVNELNAYRAFLEKISELPSRFNNLENEINSCSNTFYNAFENNSFDEGSLAKCADIANDDAYKIQNVIYIVNNKISELEQRKARLWAEYEVAQANYEAALAYEAQKTEKK